MRLENDRGRSIFVPETMPYLYGLLNSETCTMKYLYLLPFLLLSFNANAQCDPPRHGRVVINEVCPNNTAVATNAIGMFEDYVELFNNTPNPINLNGWFLSDRRGNRTKYQFPNVSIPGNGFLIVWCDAVGDPQQAGLNAAFSLSSLGEPVVLSNPDTVVIDFVKYGPMAENVSVGRFPNGTGPFTTMIPSFNAFNFNGDVFNLVINEFMARNGNTIADLFGEFDDWIELYNNSLNLINLNGYFLSDNSGTPSKFKFPTTVIGPNQYVLVWADNQPNQGNLHAPFGLSGSGEELILSNPDTLTIDYMCFGQQEQNITEGRFPNGIGRLASCMVPTPNGSNGGFVNTEQAKAEMPEVLLFPNPGKEYMNVKNPEQIPVVCRISDAQGRFLSEQLLQPGVNALHIAHLPKGIYIVSLPMGTAKMVIQ